MKDRKSVTCNGKAAFYAAVWNDLRQAAMDCGWALGLHGSLNADMDIMAMPWVEDAVPADEMISRIMDCFDFSDDWKTYYPLVDKTSKPNKRVVYTIPIHGDLYLDINIIDIK